jgi:hypothetical protein
MLIEIAYSVSEKYKAYNIKSYVKSDYKINTKHTLYLELIINWGVNVFSSVRDVLSITQENEMSSFPILFSTFHKGYETPQRIHSKIELEKSLENYFTKGSFKNHIDFMVAKKSSSNEYYLELELASNNLDITEEDDEKLINEQLDEIEKKLLGDEFDLDSEDYK